MFKDYADGKRVRDIVAWVNQTGAKTRKGNDFMPATIKAMLANPTYTGVLLLCKEYVGDRDIVAWVNQTGAKTRKGNDFMPATIKAMLANPTYTGVLLLCKEYVGDPIIHDRHKPCSPIQPILECCCFAKNMSEIRLSTIGTRTRESCLSTWSKTITNRWWTKKPGRKPSSEQNKTDSQEEIVRKSMPLQASSNAKTVDEISSASLKDKI